MQFGGEYMDENPIAGKPGEFHLSSTGRPRDRIQQLQVPSLSTSFEGTRSGLSAAGKPGTGPTSAKEEKTPKTPKTPAGMPSKPKRRKSKAGATPTSS
jgi:mediator of RNA polymerase II transcription subunit 6